MKGVPEFWLTIFKNVELLQEMVQEHDEAVLKSLYDITVTFNKDPMVRRLKLVPICQGFAIRQYHSLFVIIILQVSGMCLISNYLCDDLDLMT